MSWFLVLPNKFCDRVADKHELEYFSGCLVVNGFVVGAELEADVSCLQALVFRTARVDNSAAW